MHVHFTALPSLAAHKVHGADPPGPCGSVHTVAHLRGSQGAGVPQLRTTGLLYGAGMPSPGSSTGRLTDPKSCPSGNVVLVDQLWVFINISAIHFS